MRARLHRTPEWVAQKRKRVARVGCHTQHPYHEAVHRMSRIQVEAYVVDVGWPSWQCEDMIGVYGSCGCAAVPREEKWRGLIELREPSVSMSAVNIAFYPSSYEVESPTMTARTKGHRTQNCGGEGIYLPPSAYQLSADSEQLNIYST